MRPTQSLEQVHISVNAAVAAHSRSTCAPQVYRLTSACACSLDWLCAVDPASGLVLLGTGVAEAEKVACLALFTALIPLTVSLSLQLVAAVRSQQETATKFKVASSARRVLCSPLETRYCSQAPAAALSADSVRNNRPKPSWSGVIARKLQTSKPRRPIRCTSCSNAVLLLATLLVQRFLDCQRCSKACKSSLLLYFAAGSRAEARQR